MSAKPEAELDSDFNEYDRLFHYTSSAGLYGILESGCLWATHYRFLNDSRELFRARDAIVAHVAKAILHTVAKLKVNKDVHFKEGVDLKDASAEEAAAIVDAMYVSTLGEPARGIIGLGTPYIFSTFCCNPNEAEAFEKGVLVHWGTYARSGGYAIQLNPHKVKSLLDKERDNFPNHFSLSKKISYLARDDIPPDLKAAFAVISEMAKTLTEVDARGGDIRKVDAGRTLEPFVTAICCTKDGFFRLEEEARVVVVRPPHTEEYLRTHDVYMRVTPGLTAPYVKLFEGNLLGDLCPIERVLVGPHPDNERRVIALRAYLESRKLGHIRIDVSRVPYQTQLG